MIRNLVIASVALSAATCQAGILSQFTLTNTVATEPTSVQYGFFEQIHGPFGETVSPFVANTDYYFPANIVQMFNYMVTHPAEFETHGPLWFNLQGDGLGSIAVHYLRFGDNYSDCTCATSAGSGAFCSGDLTVAGTADVYTVPWNQMVMRYDYVPQPAGGFATTMTLTISNVPEPASLALLVLAVAGGFFVRNRRR